MYDCFYNLGSLLRVSFSKNLTVLHLSYDPGFFQTSTKLLINKFHSRTVIGWGRYPNYSVGAAVSGELPDVDEVLEEMDVDVAT